MSRGLWFKQLLSTAMRLADELASIRIGLPPRGVSSNPLFDRLLRGKTLSSGEGPVIDGRLDFRKSIAPSGARSPHRPGIARVDALDFRKTSWTLLDLSRSRLRSFRFFDACIEGCRFDDADCSDWRLWGTHVRDTSFRGADLRDTSMGGVSDRGRRNHYERVDFSGADLRGSGHFVAAFEHCDFSGARLDGVDFQGSVFSHCRFQGEVSDVQFYRHAFRGEQYPPNEMTEVDFSAARLHYVEFRRLDMASVRWPDGNAHILVRDYARTLDRMIEALRGRVDDAALGLGGLLSSARQWAGANQQLGVINKADVAELGDPSLVQLLDQIAAEAS